VQERIDIVVSQSGARVVARDISTIGQAANKSADAVDLLKKAMATISVGLLTRELVRLLDTFTNLQNKLRASGLEGENLGVVYKELLSVSNETRSSLEGSVALYSRLSTSAKELGASQKDLLGFTKSLNQAIILSGASGQEAAAGLQQLAQGMGTGVLAGDELKSILENLPIVADTIAAGLGTTRGELKKLGADGKIAATDILDAFKKARAELEDRFGKTIPTISQSFQILRNNLIDMVGRFDQATGASAAISKMLMAIANNLDDIAKGAVAVASGFALIGGGAKLINLTTSAVKGLTIAIAANPIGALAVLITSATVALALFSDEIKIGVDDVTTLADLSSALGETMVSVFTEIGAWAKKTFGPMVDLIKDFVGEFDLSLVGILTLVAKGIDSYIGLWVGAIDAVVTLFKGLGPALGDLMTQALNFILSKIGNFVNSAGDLLSSVTEFAGLGKIATSLDFTIDNENKGAAEQLGKDVMAAFREGFDSTNPAQDFLTGLTNRAQEIAKEREANKKAPGELSDESGARGLAPAALAKLTEELDKLVGSYDQAYSAAQEYAKALVTLNQAESAGLISAERKAEVLGVIEGQLQDALDPMGAVNRMMDEEYKLLQMTTDARNIAMQLKAIEQDMLAQGIVLNEQELQQFEKRLELLDREAKAAEIRNQVYDQVKGSQADYILQLQSINQLIADGLISQGEANAFLVEQNSGLLDGTAEAQAAWVTQYEDTYAQIEALRQADLISEETANQLKARAQADLLSKQLQGAKALFSEMEGLTRSRSRKLAEIGKAGSIMQAIANTYEGATKALAQGGIYGGVMAGLVVANGLNMVDQIRNASPGFMLGGYTGDMGTTDVAGVVHGKEYVMDAASTARIGVNNLDAMRKGNWGGQQSGGGVNVSIQNYGTSKTFEVEQLSPEDIRIIARDEASREIRKTTPDLVAAGIGDPNSKISKSLSNSTTTERRR
jgi:tape measure domain-containing protein